MKRAFLLSCGAQGFILWINKIILTINQFIVRIIIGYSKDKSIYPYCILIYVKDKSCECRSRDFRCECDVSN